jgi:hypothetical protein
MNAIEASERRALVRRLRNEFRPHFFMRCLEVAYRIIPCCNSCEYNRTGTCTAPQLTFSDGHSISGFAIKDENNLCLQWSPSPSAIMRALQHVYNVRPSKATPIKAAPASCKADISDIVRRYYTKEITAAEAAALLNMGKSTFYAKARKMRPAKPYRNEKFLDIVRRYHAKEITAAEAADLLNIKINTFYVKAAKLRRETQNDTN